MHTKQQLITEIQAADTTEAITQTFEEVAAARMQAMRGSVAKTRVFLNEVDAVYHEVKKAYQVWYKQKELSRQTQHITEKSAITKNGRTCRIILSANAGLYGDLPGRIVHKFLEEYGDEQKNKDVKVDIVVVGVVAQYLLDAQTPKIPYKAFTINDDHPSDQEIAKIVEYILPYETVTVTYGQFQSVLSLMAETIDISGGTSLANNQPVGHTENAPVNNQFVLTGGESVIFEPSATAIAMFFESEIAKALLKQKIYEMQLARFSSRLVAMDSATERAKEYLALLAGEERKLKRKNSNRKLQQLFAGSSLW